MSPTMQDQDYVMSVCWWRMRYQVNDVVIIQHAIYGTIIKRIIERKPTGEVLLAGDNSTISTSSQRLGWQQPRTIAGKLIWHIASPREI